MFACTALLLYLLVLQWYKLFIQVDKAKGHYENLSLTSACETVLEIGNLGNLYIDEQAPWSCFKQGGEIAEKAAKVNTWKLKLYLFLFLLGLPCLFQILLAKI